MTTFRPLAEADDAGLRRLLDGIAQQDGAEPFSEFKSVDLARRGGHTVIGEDEGRIVAAGHAAFHHGDRTSRPHWAIEIALDPVRRSSEEWVAATRAIVGALPPESNHVVWVRDAAMEPAVESLGYRATRRLARMERSLPTGFVVSLPRGVVLAPFEPGRDDDAWLAVNNAAFAGHPENGGLTKEDLAERLALGWFRPEDLLMAWEDAMLVGSCWTKRHSASVGEIYVIGVHPEHQGRGLGRALVTAGLDHMASGGATTAMLFVDRAEDHAMRLYRSLGFAVVGVISMYVPGKGPGIF